MVGPSRARLRVRFQASVYKGRVAVLAQALRAAIAERVLEPVLDDLVATGLADREIAPRDLASASRSVALRDEMRRSAATQAAGGLRPISSRLSRSSTPVR